MLVQNCAYAMLQIAILCVRILAVLRGIKEDTQGEKPYICDFADCKQAFSESKSLKTHKRSHTGERPYKCDVKDCTYTCTTSCSLTLHIRTHTNERPFKCDVGDCDYACGSGSALVVHKRTHTNERPYTCDFENCDYASVNSSHLTRHKLTHTGEKPFKCHHCDFASATSSNLKQHSELHETQKSYQFECKMQDHGTQLCSEGDIKCSIRTKSQFHMDMQIERNHTLEGIGKKLQSESKLEEFFKSKKIPATRDWENVINFKYCKNIEVGPGSARPDFYLLAESVRLSAIVLVGNDEFGHRRYPCDFKRVFNICSALEQNPDSRGLPILYIRFNPHFYTRDGVYFSHDLETAHEILLSTLQNITSLKPRVNLVYIHYDQTNGELDIFHEDDENDYAKLYKNCVLLKV